MRINKYLSSLGIASRRDVDKLIEAKKITVNGVLADFGMKVSDSDDIVVNGKKITNTSSSINKVYYMLNKPMEVLSSASDDRGRKTVVDIVHTDERIFPIGRLDYMTTGLILLTNDGELFNKIIHPRTEVFKTYHVTVNGKLMPRDVKKLMDGVELDDGMTLPCIIKDVKLLEEKTEFDISIREGRNRQVRRMMEKVGHKVIRLSRTKIGTLALGDLKSGKYRQLTKKEIEYLYSL